MNDMEFADQIEAKKLEKTTIFRFGQTLGKKIIWFTNIVVPDTVLVKWHEIISKIVSKDEK